MKIRTAKILTLLSLSVACGSALTQTTISVIQGWNLLGNGNVSPITVASALNDKTAVTTVWLWNADTSKWSFYTPQQTDGGASYASGKSYNFLTTIPVNQGFWVNAAVPFTLTLNSSGTGSIATGSTTNTTATTSSATTTTTVASVTTTTVSSSAVAPTAPSIIGVMPGDSRISVAFNFIGGRVGALAKMSDSANASEYTATCTSSDGGATGTGKGNNPIMVGSLTNGKSYTCAVTATTPSGGSAKSGNSSSTIPNAGPFTTGGLVLASAANTAHITAYPNYASYCNYTNESTTGGVSAPPSISAYPTSGGSKTSITSSATLTCSGTSTRTLTSNAIPDHISSTFFTNGLSAYLSQPYTSGNPNEIGAKSVSKTFPYSGTIATGYTPGTAGYSTTACYVKKAAGDTKDSACTMVGFAYYNNGVKVEPGTAETYTGTSNTYNVEAKNYYQDVGLDPSNAHNQPTMNGSNMSFYGYYHYHGMPEGQISRLGKGNSTMTLVGFAADGFPIYARYGYTARTNTSGGVSIMKANYRVRTAAELTAAGYTDRPSTAVAPYGSFVQDWVFDATVGGDLDACNGRYGVTPESPSTAVYHYMITDTYPYIPRCSWANSSTIPSWGYSQNMN